MPRATWKGTTIAESSATRMVEGNHYFPVDSLKREHFLPGLCARRREKRIFIAKQ